MHVVFINTVVWEKFNIITTKFKCTKYFYQSINREGKLSGKLVDLYDSPLQMAWLQFISCGYTF